MAVDDSLADKINKAVKRGTIGAVLAVTRTFGGEQAGVRAAAVAARTGRASGHRSYLRSHSAARNSILASSRRAAADHALLAADDDGASVSAGRRPLAGGADSPAPSKNAIGSGWRSMFGMQPLPAATKSVPLLRPTIGGREKSFASVALRAMNRQIAASVAAAGGSRQGSVNPLRASRSVSRIDNEQVIAIFLLRFVTTRWRQWIS